MMKPLINITPAMVKKTEDKFRSWDAAVIESKRVFKEEHLALLEDPTIFAYAFLKDDNGNQYKCFPYQDIILNDPNRYICVVGSFQIGKTDVLRIKALHYAWSNPGKTVLLVSKTLPQSTNTLLRMKDMLRRSTLPGKRLMDGMPDNKTELYLKCDDEGIIYSRVICVPATEAALGYTADLGLADEIATYEQGVDFYERIFETRTNSTKGQIIVISNPRGQKGILWKLYNNPRFSTYRFAFLSRPDNTKEELEQKRKDLGVEYNFREYYMAEFLTARGGFLSPTEINDAAQEDYIERLEETTPIYVFVDLAKKHDHSVIIVGKINYDKQKDEESLEVIWTKEFALNTDYSVVGAEMKRIYNHYNVRGIGCDQTGVGESFTDLLRNEGVSLQGIIFSLSNKSKMYTDLKMLFEQRRIKIPNDEEFKKQLGSLNFKRTTGGQLQVHHENENDLDDYPDALAGLIAISIKPSYVRPSIAIV